MQFYNYLFYLNPFSSIVGIVLDIVHSFSMGAWEVILSLVRSVELERKCLGFSCGEVKIDVGSIISDISIIPSAAIGVIVGVSGIDNLPT
jgi:hypothetical protein